MSYLTGSRKSGKKPLSIEEALEKVYTIIDRRYGGSLYLPKCLKNKKVKLVLVEDE